MNVIEQEFFKAGRRPGKRLLGNYIDSTGVTMYESMRQLDFLISFQSPKVQRENEELHKTSAFLADQARSAERAMERIKWA